MSLNKNDLFIANIIFNNPLSIHELSKITSTSERNIRYTIKNLNSYLMEILGCEINKNMKKLVLNISKDSFNYFINSIYKKHYILHQEERVDLILLLFLFCQNIKLSYIEEKLNITRATLKRDMESVSKILSQHSLFFDFTKNKFSIQGNEKKLRHLKTLKFLEFFNLKYPNFENFKLNNDLFSDISLKKNFYIFSFIGKNEFSSIINLGKVPYIFSAIENIEKNFNFSFSNDFKELIFVFLLITVERIQTGHIIDRKNNYNFIINTQQFPIIASSLELIIPSKYSYELAHLTEYFVSGGLPVNILEFNDIMAIFINSLLEYIKTNIDQKKYNKFKLEIVKSKLTDYLIPAIYRLKNNFSLGSIGEKNDIYFLVDKFCNSTNLLPEKLTQNEIYFISTIINFYLNEDNHKILNLDKLLKIIEMNCDNFNKEKFIDELSLNYYEIFK